MPHFNAPGTRLYYEQHGQGAPLVLIAGYTCDLNQWVAVRGALAEHFALLLVDNRGVGRSDTPDGTWTIDDMADDLVALVRGLGLERVHLVGHSLGAAIALTFARRYPQHVDKLVLSNGLARLRPAARVAFEWLLTLRQRGLDSRLLLEGLFPWIFSNGFLADRRHIDGAIAMTLANPYPQSYDGQAAQLTALKHFDARSWLHEIPRPALLLAGDEDICAPRGDSEQLAAGLRGSTVAVLPGVAHLPMLEAPVEFARQVVAFCR